jgi:hypothetical protein
MIEPQPRRESPREDVDSPVSAAEPPRPGHTRPRTTKEAKWLLDDRPGYRVVRVELPDEYALMRAEGEPYPAVRDEIPAEYLTVVGTVGE